MQLETQRLILRPFTEGDAQDVYDYAKDPRVGPAAGWTPHRSDEESREIIRTVFSEPDVFAVVDRESGKVIGSAGFTGRHRKELPDPDDEIGYSLHPDYWGRGRIPERWRSSSATALRTGSWLSSGATTTTAIRSPSG